MAVDQPDTQDLAHEPISPELVLVSPDLAEFARAQLPEHAPSIAIPKSNGAPAPLAEAWRLEPLASVAVPVPQEPPAEPRRRRRRRSLKLFFLAVVLPGLLVVGVIAGLKLGRSSGQESGAPREPVPAGVLGSPANPPPVTTHQASAPRVHKNARHSRAQPRRARATRSKESAAGRTSGAAKAKKARNTRAKTAPKLKARTKTPAAPARRPKITPQVVAPTDEPVLKWSPVADASYYDVQLFRGNVRILDLWPSTARVTVPTSWVYGGVHYRLQAGPYRWYVYPGGGDRSQLLLGKLHKVGVLVVARHR